MAKRDSYRDQLRTFIGTTLENGDRKPLEAYLTERGSLSVTMANLPMAHTFADIIGEDFATDVALNQLLDPWAALSIETVPVGDNHEILPMTAVLTYGQLAVARPDWWDAMVGRLFAAATDGRWRIREVVAAAFQRMLDADWQRAYAELQGQMASTDPLVLRALVAAVAEPPILKAQKRGEDALQLQDAVVKKFAAIPAAQRADENVRVLRQALGFTISVAVAAAPDPGFALLGWLASQPDKDIQWIVRENLKKNRLQKWPDKLESLRGLHG